jgi:hypothetical protein
MTTYKKPMITNLNLDYFQAQLQGSAVETETLIPELSGGSASCNSPTSIEVIANYTDLPDDVIGGTVYVELTNSSGTITATIPVVTEGEFAFGANAFAADGQIYFGITGVTSGEDYVIEFVVSDVSGNTSNSIQVEANCTPV